MRVGGTRAIVAAGALALHLAAWPAAAQDNSCRYAVDGACDEPDIGTGVCAAGTDSWDCRREGVLSADACHFARDGTCDEPSIGTAACPRRTDTTDCGGRWSPAFSGRDDRVFVDSTRAPWSSIGWIETASGHCSGVLVGPRLVLTAAHCFFKDDASNEREAASVFIAGRDGPNEVARSAVVREILPPRFDNRRHAQTSALDGEDWAFVVLEEPIGDVAGFMRVDPATREEMDARLAAGLLAAVTQAGYSGDHATKLTAHEGCAVTELFDDGTFFHECDTIDGDSGSPFFVADAEGFVVLGVMSAIYPKSDDDELEMGVLSERFYKAWLRLSEELR
ncbi:trypsin-like serine protease [Salinarimonas sp.]|uniref:trypsin-like serine peptidase n=1 Tax=Salinarimonas sp. TaxID=2766526 RepID=UPI0032D97C30